MNILVVKLSSLGDVVHAMPAVQDMLAAHADAQLDWVVEPAFAPLVQRCAGVQRVIPCDLRRWRRAPLSPATWSAWRGFRADLQSCCYDAVIDLQGLSKSAWVAWQARTTPTGRRYAMANQTEGSGYEAPTRWVADVAIPLEPHIHAVRRSRELCAQALGYRVGGPDRYGLRAGSAVEASEDVMLGTLTARPCVALVHGSSRADKLWPDGHWTDLAHRLDGQGFDVALLHGNDAEERRSVQLAAGMPNARVWSRLRLDAMVDALAGCAGVIGVDSGISHIAVALDLPHVQIYNFDTAWRTGPQDCARQRSVFGRPTPGVEAVWQAWQQVFADAVPPAA